MNSEFLNKKRSFATGENRLSLDIFLDLITTILKKEDGERCICTNRMPSIDNKSSFHEKEIVSNLDIWLSSDGKFKLMDIISHLKMLGYPLTGGMISVYMGDSEDYVLMGSDPLDNNILLNSEHFSNGIIKIRVLAYVEEKHLNQPLSVVNNNIAPKFGSSGFRITRSNSSVKKSKRTKERKIGYIIEKVNTWRKLYNGFYDETGKFTKYSLDESAKIIGISKKSLDDYLLQLRLGRKYGFDFNSNKQNKVGILRSFVKKNRTGKGD
jgi:hypothetical protein